MDKQLFIEKGEFKNKLALQIAEGKAIWDIFTQLQGSDTFLRLERSYRKWDNYNYKWLEYAFRDEAPNGYSYYYFIVGMDTLGSIASSILERTDSIDFKYNFFSYIITPKIEYLEDLLDEVEFMRYIAPPPPAPSAISLASNPLANLHPTIQQVASSLYATGHYRQALLDAFIAVDNAVRDKSQLAHSGTRLMEVAFSPGNPVLKISDNPDEQQGFMALFRGAMLAIRNPKAHSLNGTHDAQRALEWLSFASVLLRNLDEAVLVQPLAPPPAP